MYFYYHYFYPWYDSMHYFPVRQYPPVDPDMFFDSANAMTSLMNDAARVLDKIAGSKPFAEQIMTAAQASDKEEVERLIGTVGVDSELDINFNPNSLRLEFKEETKESEMACCRLLLTLRWQ
ncbi:hypothetical protein [Virgibacillus kimchii]